MQAKVVTTIKIEIADTGDQNIRFFLEKDSTIKASEYQVRISRAYHYARMFGVRTPEATAGNCWFIDQKYDNLTPEEFVQKTEALKTYMAEIIEEAKKVAVRTVVGDNIVTLITA